jgi:hypothetical protein
MKPDILANRGGGYLSSLVIFLLLTATVSAAQASYKIEPRASGVMAARDAVRRYCQLDFDGARLTDATWARMRPVTIWSKNPDFQLITVAGRYQLTEAHQVGRNVFVSVDYEVLGHFELGLGYTPAPLRETLAFAVRQNGDTWKIEDVEPAMLPHVSRARMLAWVREQLNTEKDPVMKTSLQRAAGALEKK